MNFILLEGLSLYIFLILFGLICALGIVGFGMAVADAVANAVEKRRRRKEYYRWLEVRNRELERRVNFYRLQQQGIDAVEVIAK